MVPIVSIIIPTYNEEKDIAKCLNSLQNQSYKNFEIIIVDDGSVDKTKEIVQEFLKKDKRIKIIKGEHKGPGFSRNLGAKKAKGEILVFVDADMILDKNYIKNLIKPILEDKTNKIIGATHYYEPVSNLDNIWSRCWNKVRVSKEEANTIKIFRAIRKEKFLELGGFDPKYGYADDLTFWIKYKIKPITAYDTICYHKNPETLKEIYKQSKWIGASLAYKYPLFKIKGLNIIIIFLIILLSPIIYPFLTIFRMFKRKDFNLFFAYWPFMAARYFGTLNGLVNFVILKRNVK